MLLTTDITYSNLQFFFNVVVHFFSAKNFFFTGEKFLLLGL